MQLVPSCVTCDVCMLPQALRGVAQQGSQVCLALEAEVESLTQQLDLLQQQQHQSTAADSDKQAHSPSTNPDAAVLRAELARHAAELQRRSVALQQRDRIIQQKASEVAQLEQALKHEQHKAAAAAAAAATATAAVASPALVAGARVAVVQSGADSAGRVASPETSAAAKPMLQQQPEQRQQQARQIERLRGMLHELAADNDVKDAAIADLAKQLDLKSGTGYAHTEEVGAVCCLECCHQCTAVCNQTWKDTSCMHHGAQVTDPPSSL